MRPDFRMGATPRSAKCPTGLEVSTSVSADTEKYGSGREEDAHAKKLHVMKIHHMELFIFPFAWPKSEILRYFFTAHCHAGGLFLPISQIVIRYAHQPQQPGPRSQPQPQPRLHPHPQSRSRLHLQPHGQVFAWPASKPLHGDAQPRPSGHSTTGMRCAAPHSGSNGCMQPRPSGHSTAGIRLCRFV